MTLINWAYADPNLDHRHPIWLNVTVLLFLHSLLSLFCLYLQATTVILYIRFMLGLGKSWKEQHNHRGVLGYNCLSCHFCTLHIPCEACWKGAGSRGWQVPGGLGVYSVTQESSAGLGLERQLRLPVLPKKLHITGLQSKIQSLWISWRLEEKQTKSSVKILWFLWLHLNIHLFWNRHLIF